MQGGGEVRGVRWGGEETGVDREKTSMGIEMADDREGRRGSEETWKRGTGTEREGRDGIDTETDGPGGEETEGMGQRRKGRREGRGGQEWEVGWFGESDGVDKGTVILAGPVPECMTLVGTRAR